MFDNSNPYTLRAETIEGIAHYYISFTDGGGVHRETEISRPVFLEFERFVRVERNLRRWDERHIEQSDLTDEELFTRAAAPPTSIDDAVYGTLRNAQLRLAIQSLPEIQRRRFILHHEFGLTYQQISTIEGCSGRAVVYSVSSAKEKIKNFFEKQTS